jgi:ketosteroid isomerase-like protein
MREQVREAAESEALAIVTAARRDVRRIVVEARRELLVLTAQLHAAIDSVDQASLHAATQTASGSNADSAVTDVLTGQRALGDTEDMVLGVRREVRTVLDEARAEIEALAAEAHEPLRQLPSALTRPSPEQESIPTLEKILGSDPLSSGRAAGAGPLPAVDLEQLPVDSMSRNERDDRDGDDHGPGGGGTRRWQSASGPRGTGASGTSQPAAAGSPGAVALADIEAAVTANLAATATLPGAALVTRTVEAAVSLAPAPAHETAAEIAAPADHVLADFDETSHVMEPGRTFLADYDQADRPRRSWMWVGLFAATGIVAVVGTVWWFTLRDSGTALATSLAEPGEPALAAAPAPVATRTAASAISTAGPSGLVIQVRRTAWIRTVVDGKEDSRVYQAGETRQIDGARAVSIRAGDGGAVFVSVDGSPAEPLGTSGLAVTKQFSLASTAPEPVPALVTAPASPAVQPVADRSPVPNPPEPSVLLSTPGARPVETARTTTPVTAPAAPPTAGPVPAAQVPAAPVPAALSPAAPAPTSAPPTENAAAPAGGGRADLIAAGQQWLDAYQRRDNDAMSLSGTENMSVLDQRSVTERFPVWQAGIRRDLDQLELNLSGDTALLTARMTERSGEAAASPQHVSRVSQIWVRRAGRWRLADVRIIGEAQLNQIVR